MVHSLPDASPAERAEIKREWLRLIECSWYQGGASYARRWGAVPKDFYDKHKKAVFARKREEDRRWRERLARRRQRR